MKNPMFIVYINRIKFIYYLISNLCYEKNSFFHLPKKFFFLEPLSTIYGSGAPITSIIHANCSSSLSPGKIGYPMMIKY